MNIMDLHPGARKREIIQRFTLRLGLILLAAGMAIAGCRSEGHRGAMDSSAKPGLSITMTPPYLPADGASCRLVVLQPDSQLFFSPPPDLTTDLGVLSDPVLNPRDGYWEATLCAGAATGRVHFSSVNYNLSSPPSIYFVPPEPEFPYDPVEMSLFSLTIDPPHRTVTLTSAGLINPYALAPQVSLTTPIGYLFEGSTLIVGVSIVGSAVPQDLVQVRAVVDEVSTAASSLLNPDGVDDSGRPYFYYGGFFSNDHLPSGADFSQWAASWQIHLADSTPFTVSGRVLGWLPSFHGSSASLDVAPFLTQLTSNSVTVTWSTDVETRGFVVYGPTPDCDLVAGGSSERAQLASDYFSPPEFDSFLHRVTITGLQPGATYYYRVITLETEEATPPEPFRTALPAGQPFSFGVIADTQDGGAHTVNLIAQMKNAHLDFVLHAGDLVTYSNILSQWRGFFANVQPLTKNVPMFPTFGNHDQAVPELFYLRYFHAESPFPNDPDLKDRMYSFTFGNSHFTTIDTMLPLEASSPEYQWLAADLTAAAADPAIKFIIVWHHFPLHNAFPYGQFPGLQGNLDPLYRACRVNAVFTGHVHLYQRHNVDGRIDITAGSSGGFLMIYDPLPDQSRDLVTFELSYHWVKVDVGADSFHVTVYNEAGAIIDQVDSP